MGGTEPTSLLRTVFTCASDRKSTRLNSSHVEISYAVFCLKKKTSRRGDGQGGPAVCQCYLVHVSSELDLFVGIPLGCVERSSVATSPQALLAADVDVTPGL